MRGDEEHDLPLVLVVEDDPDVRAVLTRILVEDYRVVAVESAEAGLDVARQLQPDLVLCDLVLPGASGEHLLQSLRREDATAHTPVVVVTGQTDEAQRVRLLRNGAVDLVVKPFLPDELRARIDNVLAGRLDLDRLRARVEAAQTLAAQLQHALDSRVVIEQAKGLLAGERGTSVAEAYERMRSHARHHNRKLQDVARAVVEDGYRF